MEKIVNSPQFGDFLLHDGTYCSQVNNTDNVKGIFLIDGVSLVTFSPKKKMYRKTRDWCSEYGGVVPSVKILLFIFFHFEEINKVREAIGLEPIPRNLLVWSSESMPSSAYTVLNHAVDMNKGTIKTLVSDCSQLDDCGIANVICVVGEPKDKRSFF